MSNLAFALCVLATAPLASASRVKGSMPSMLAHHLGSHPSALLEGKVATDMTMGPPQGDCELYDLSTLPKVREEVKLSIKENVVGGSSDPTDLCKGAIGRGYAWDSIRGNDTVIMVAVEKQKPLKICGFVTIELKERSAYIDVICSHMGYGKQLLEMSERYAMEKGKTIMNLQSLETARSFYEANGYRHCSDPCSTPRENQVQAGLGLYDMAKCIKVDKTRLEDKLEIGVHAQGRKHTAAEMEGEDERAASVMDLADFLRAADLDGKGVDDDIVKELAQHCGALQKIKLSWTEVTDVGIKELAKHCPSLQTIDLTSTAVTDVGVKELAKGCPNLENVDIGNTKVTDEGIKELAKGCPKLESVNVRSTRVTDEGIKELAKGCPKLISVDLAENYVTDEGIKEIATNCRELQEITLRYTKVTDKGVQELLQKCPLLTEVVVPRGLETHIPIWEKSFGRVTIK